MRTSDAGADVGVMHACGHDVHRTSFLGTATLLSHLKSEWSGTLVMIGQPAEERGAGAKAMLEDGLYELFPRPHVVETDPVMGGEDFYRYALKDREVPISM